MRRLLFALAAILGSVPLCSAVYAATPVGTSFAFQGQLRVDLSPANGPYDFRFELFDSATGPTSIATAVLVDDHPVSSGLFKLELDFGADVFGEDARWLFIAVRPGASTGSYTPLDPRQELLATPYSLATRGLVVDVAGNLVVDGNIQTGAKVLAGTYSSTSPFIMEAPEGSERARIDDTTGRFGIGETDPLAKLHIQVGNVPFLETSLASFENDVLIEGNVPWLSLSGSGNSGVAAGLTLSEVTENETYKWSMFSRTNGNAGDLNFTYGLNLSPAANTQVMQLMPDGDVGIGKQPAARLHVYAENESFDLLKVMRLESRSNVPAGAQHYALDFGRNQINARNPATGAGRALHLNPGSDGDVVLAIGGGKVGVGTSAPLRALHVKSNTALSVTASLTNDDVVVEDTSAWLGLYSRNDGGVGSGIVLGEVDFEASTTIHKWSLFARNTNNVGDLVVTYGTGAPGSNLPVLWLGRDGVTKVQTLEIAGADLAEKFPINGTVSPGAVVEIDPANQGKLRLARGAYNRRVAGIVSGAGNIPVGAILGNLPGHEDSPPIALSGRVWVQADATKAPIAPGDLLTTSDIPGHAMKVINYSHAQGAIVGKAMTSLSEGKGLVLVLVTLQ